MLPECEDFCTWVFVVVDDLWEQIAPFFKRPGPAPVCSDSELIAVALIGECRGWHMETELLSCWKEYRAMFHHIPSQSRFNRHRRNLMQAFNLIRQCILRRRDLSMDRQWSIESLPTPVVHFHLVPGTSARWASFWSHMWQGRDEKADYFWLSLASSDHSVWSDPRL